MELTHASNVTQHIDYEIVISGHQRLVWVALIIAILALISAVYICCCLYSLRGKLDMVKLVPRDYRTNAVGGRITVRLFLQLKKTELTNNIVIICM